MGNMFPLKLAFDKKLNRLLPHKRFIVQSLPKGNQSFLDEEEKFQEKLLRLSEDTFSTHSSSLPPPLRILQEHVIQQCAVGPEHLAFLLDDGNVCRITYSATMKSAFSSKVPEDASKEKPKSGPRSSKMIRRSSHSLWGNMDFLAVTGSGSWSRWANRSGVRSSGLSGTTTTEASSARKTIRTSSNSNSSDSITSSGIRLIRANQVRGRNLPLFSGSQKVVVPASHVPEELINQVQNVLQGKTRSVILKELQRTHLDVNMAVNNLLSRDDEDNDDMEDGASDYIPGEELMSLLDSGMPPGDHARVVIDADAMLPEDLLGYTFSSRSMSSGSRRGGNDDTEESRSQWYDSKSTKTPGMKESDVVLGECLEWWDEGTGLIKFKDIGSMYSELVAIDVHGNLRQWKWSDTKPAKHPKVEPLGLEKEKISFLATSLIQASVITEDGGMATWMDDVVATHTSFLDLPLSSIEAFKNERVKSLRVCSLYSAVLTEQDRVYWWGIPSYNQRKKLIDKSQSGLQHSADNESTSKQKLAVGDQVCLRSFPIYHSGAIAVNISGGLPKIGHLLQSVWKGDSKGLFKVVSSIDEAHRRNENSDMKVDCEEQTPALDSTSNLRKWKTLVDNSSADSSSRKRKRSEVDDEDDKTEEEMWDLKDIVFVEDSHSLPTVGRVAKVDGNIIAVNFGAEDQDGKDLDKVLTSCRLLHSDDVMHVKCSSSKPLDCIQKTPKKLMVDSHFHLHCIEAGEGGITAVATHDRDSISFIKLSLTSGKVTSQRRFPTKSDSFFDQSSDGSGKFSSKAKLLGCGSGSPTLLQDYNSMLYPLLGDENGGIRDPIWADIPPLCASGMGFCLDSSNSRSVLVVLAFRSQVLMPLIMSRDLKGFRSLLNTVENNQDAAWAKVFYQSLLNERCDGQRNVLHMSIEMSVPSSNKEQREDEEAQSKVSASGEQATSLRLSPSKSVANTATSDSNSASFLPDGERINAVSAIANAISCVRGFATPASRESSSRDTSSSTKPASFPPNTPPFLLPGIEPSNYSVIPRSSSEFLSRSPPGSPVSMWPCDRGSSPWKSDEKKDEEKGMNLSKKANKDSWSEVITSDRGSRLDAVAILKLICKSKCVQPYLKQLLKHKDSNGYTPFLFAVAHRAYPAALAIFKAAYSIAMDGPVAEESMKENYKSFSASTPMNSFGQSELLSMLYPPGSDPDDNPMHMLCCNDTCSFTWTGALHINQDIFECLTCGLTETLCCCTECARVCHKGHDCKLKRTSPTAYCDCWEKCACRSLVEGSVPDRTALLRVLLHTTDLYERYNSNGEHIIHFLIKTVARQCEEQRQYRPPARGTINPRISDDHRHYRPPPRTARMSAGSMRHRINSRHLPSGGEQDMPEHDLRPPQFCREALLQLLSDFHAVRSLLFSGCKNRRDELSLSSKLDQDDALHNLLPEDKLLLSSQSGTSRLDSFTHTLIVKCTSPDYLNRLLETLIHAVQVNKHRDHDDGVIMARRFLRSVIRIFIVLTAQSTPDKLAAKLSLYNQSALAKCRRTFTALITLSIEELCETAEALIAPVRMGVAKPTSAYPLFSNASDIILGSTAAFSKLPLPPKLHRSDDDDDDGDNDKQNKRKVKKSRKKSKRSTSRPIGSVVVGEEQQSQETGNDDESDHNLASQDTQQEDEPIDGLQRLFRDISDQIEADARNDDATLVEDESDMEITDNDVAPESDSDLPDHDHIEQSSLMMGRKRSHDRESQHDEEDEDGDGQGKRNDEEDTDSDAWQDEVNLERRSTREQRAQARETPHAMQWAMGVHSMVPIKGPASSGGIQSIGSSGGGSTGGVNYVNSRSMRRNDSSLENAYLNSVLDRRHGVVRLKHSYSDDIKGTSSVSATNAQLSRLFSTCVREVVHLLASLRSGTYMSATTLGTILEVSYQESSALRNSVQSFLEQTWKWLLVVIESTESQLHYGQVLSMTSNLHPPDHKGDARRSRGSTRHGGSSSEDNMARQDFISYILSLLRSHSDEHSDILPVVDVSSMKHIAYVLDAYVYYLRVLSTKQEEEGKSDNSGSHGISLDIGYENSDNEEEEEDDSQMNYQEDLYNTALQSDSAKAPQFPEDCSSVTQPSSLFFHRSESMTFLGCVDANTFEVPLPTAIPLAEKPHLLRPNSRKEELFGRPRGCAENNKFRSQSLSLSTRTTSMGVSPDLPLKEDKNPLNSNPVDAPPSYSSLNVSEGKLVEDNSDHHPSDTPRCPSTSSSDKNRSSSGSLKVESHVEKEHAIDAVAMETSVSTVTIDTTEHNAPSSKPHDQEKIENEIASAHSVLARCRLTLELFSRMFLDSVGAEAKSILYELGGFEVREVKFRKEMERIRTSQTVDLHLNVERSRDLLIQQTLKQLNQQAKRKSGSSQPLAVLRVKVQFENEPGEGTGVARSFYTAIAEALLSSARLPSLDGILPGSSSSSNRKSPSLHLSLVARLYKREREREERSSRAGSSRTTALSSGGSERSINLRSFLTARYRELATGGQRDSNAAVLSHQASPFVKRSSRSHSNQSSLERSKQAIGDRLHPKVSAINSVWASKITGMLLELPAYELLLLLRSDRSLHERVTEAANLLVSNGYSQDLAESEAADERNNSDNESATESKTDKKQDENKTNKQKVDEAASLCAETDGGPPLFYQPGKRGVYAPASWGDTSVLRLNAYRNVGRLIGLCLLQNELCPLPLCRHVLKVMLGRKVHWHDLAFFDPVLYESLRQLVADSQSWGDDVLEAVDLTFMVDLQNEEGGGQVDLTPGGASLSVTKNNLMDYIRRYALYRMIGCCKKQLDKMRQGLLDVLPSSALHYLTAEDLRLLFNGCGQVDVRALISYTMFNDESGKSGSSAEKLTELKRWFWAVVDKMSQSERQDLLYFWTGSPSLPASEDGFQPMPTITIRPPDDHHLPTANTCISRLYVPLYSSRLILRQKLLLAIRTKNFGFV